MTDAQQCPYSPDSKKKQENGCDDQQLPKAEITFYALAFASIIVYAGCGFYLAYGQEPEEHLPRYILRKGWMREFKDYEDRILSYTSNNFKSMIAVSIGYLVLSKGTLAWTPMKVHNTLCACYTLTMTSLVVSPQATFAMTILYIATLCLSYYSYAAVWLALITALLVNCKTNLVERNLLLENDSGEIYFAVFGYLVCRLVSVGHSMQCRLAQRRQNGEPAPTLMQFIRENLTTTLHYTFYMPYHWCGPILTYDMFMQQMNSRGCVVSVDRKTALWVAWRSCRLVIWYFVLQLILHYLPVSAYLLTLPENLPIVYKYLSFSMYMRGQNFMLLYVQFYGWPAVLAKLDGIQLLDWPDCISWVYSYSIMWRVFDRGLFAVLRHHIYLPLGGSKHGPLRQVVAAIACFSFICIYHNDDSNIRAWVALNLIQMICERLAYVVYQNYLRNYLLKVFSPQNEKRLTGYIMAWNMMVSCGIIHLLLSDQMGFIILPEFLLLRSASRHTPFWHMHVMQFCAYCGVQIGRYYEAKVMSVSKKTHAHSS